MFSSLNCCLRRPQIVPQNSERFNLTIGREMDIAERASQALAYAKSIANITRVELEKIINLQPPMGFEPALRDGLGNNIFHYLAEKHYEIDDRDMRFLFNKLAYRANDASIFSKNNSDKTPSDIAAQNGNTIIVNIMLERSRCVEGRLHATAFNEIL